MSSSQFHIFQAEQEKYILLVDGTRVFKVDEALVAELECAAVDGDHTLQSVLAAYGLTGTPYIDDTPPNAPPVRSLSLAVAQKCNLGCTYCYAQGGSFGGPVKQMPQDVAERSVELLFSEAKPGEHVNLSFLGGEPLTNREVLQRATESAISVARSKGVSVGFSITTNGTLVTADDGAFFEKYGFAVTISLDGIGEEHDSLRPFKSGRGSFEQIINNVTPLLTMQRRMQVSVRVTVTPKNLHLREMLDRFIAMGFHSVGFSPMLASPTGREEMDGAALRVMLERMISCGEEFERRIIAGQRYPFTNMVNAMREIHKGTHRPYPCGAGASYLGVSATGDLFACHRFVDDAAGSMGNISEGVDRQQQQQWLTERHVHRQEPCRNCWARYMCGGGCHHEVIKQGRPACDYIRGWLHYCLEAYVRLLERQPDYFAAT